MPSASQPYLLTVLAGPNAGAQAPLGGQPVAVGGEGGDVVLDGWAGAPMTLAMRGERLRVRAGDAALRTGPVAGPAAGDAPPVEPGASRVLTLPATITAEAGGAPVQIHVCRVAPASKGAALRRTLMGGALLAAAVGGVVAAADAGLISMQALAGTAAERAPVGEPAPVVGAEVERAAAEAPPEFPPEQTLPERVVVDEPAQAARAAPAPEAGPDHARRAAEALAAAAAEAGLVGLEVEARGDVVRVGGRRAPEQAADWGRVRRAFDGEWGGRTPLIVDVEEVAMAAPIAVASAWLGDAPEVTTRDGAVFGVGDEVPGGWRVEAIRAGSVALARGRQNVVIEF